jgi:sulfur carrier protein
MKILVNNVPEEFAGEQMTVNELLQKKNYTFKMLVIRINGRLIKKAEYETALVTGGDDVQVLHLISGG